MIDSGPQNTGIVPLLLLIIVLTIVAAIMFYVFPLAYNKGVTAAFIIIFSLLTLIFNLKRKNQKND